MDDFDAAFCALTGNPPFPWQRALYEERFVQGKFPDACILPTGLGKTSVVAVWLLALAANSEKVPRRLVYVVNRRTVVDQTTAEVEKYRQQLADRPSLAGVATALRELCAAPTDVPLALSTLRGQYADNREWSSDPARPAVIVGTVDMIGSRLLFSGYGCGFKTRPLHAGFLGQDALLVHDEAHLEPAFQTLVEAIGQEQQRCHEAKRLRVMALTATSRGGKDMFPNDEERAANEADPTVQLRIGAKKAIEFFSVGDEKASMVKEVVARARHRAEGNAAVVVFVRSVERAGEIATQLDKVFPEAVEQLNGTLRGYERDKLIDRRVFQRFLPGPRVEHDSPAFLVCTSAGEVGVNISADHLVCDLSTFDSMAQRFGRVNRFGEPADRVARIDVVYPKEFPADDKLDDPDRRRKRTLEVLRRLNGDGSPRTLREVHRRAMEEGSGTEPMTTDQTQALREFILSTYAPPPTILPTSEILFDTWALTTAKDLPGCPPVEDYLHGAEEEDGRETHVAWRAEVKLFDDTDVTPKQLTDWLDDYPLRPHELLGDKTYRVQDKLAALGEGKTAKLPAWVVARNGTVTVTTIDELGRKDAKKNFVMNLVGRTVVLPTEAGGLTDQGTLNGGEAFKEGREYDVAGLALQPSGVPLVRLVVKAAGDTCVSELVGRVTGLTGGWKGRQVGIVPKADELRTACMEAGLPELKIGIRLDLYDPEDTGAAPIAYFSLKPVLKRDMTYPPAWPALDRHNDGAKEFATAIGRVLGLPPEVAAAVTLAASWHDLGKDRAVWQRGAGNTPNRVSVAKTLHGRAPENLNGFRHELGSLLDLAFDPMFRPGFDAAREANRELLCHLIAAHHGRGRPHFPADEAIDPERAEAWSAAITQATPGRYARLQRQFGRWGLAYLESLVRAADVLDSKRIDATPLPAMPPSGSWPRPRPAFVAPAATPLPEPTIRVTVDPTNPGQFFACCGLLELANRLWPGAEGWFAETEREFYIATRGTLLELLQRLTESGVNSSLTDVELKRLGSLQSMDKRKRTPEIAAEMEDLRTRWRLERLHLSAPFDLWLDWWRDNKGERTDLKTWAAKVQVLGMVRNFHTLVKSHRWVASSLADCLTWSVQADALPFYFDSDAGAQGSAQDAGFSAYDLRTAIKGHSPKRPLVELGSFIAFQRFRPSPVVGTDRYRFATWTTPLAISAASVVAVAAIEFPDTRRYEFQLFSRTQYMKTFLPAIPLGGSR